MTNTDSTPRLANRLPIIEAVYHALRAELADDPSIEITLEYPGFLSIAFGRNNKWLHLDVGTANAMWTGDLYEVGNTGTPEGALDTDIPSDSTDVAAIVAAIAPRVRAIAAEGAR